MTKKHVPDKFGFKPGAKAFPLMVVLNVSMDCQSSCISCPYVNNPQILKKYRKGTMFMPDALFKIIADEVGAHGAWLRLSGREPLMHPNIAELIEYAKGKGCKVGLNTNGMLLTGETRERLLDCQIDAIIVSVDAAGQETFSKVRPGLDFNEVGQNIANTKAKRDAMGSETKILASVVNQVEVSDQIESIVIFWNNYVDKVMVRKYLTWGFLDPGKSGSPEPYLGDDVPCPFIFERLNIDTTGTVSPCGYDISFEHPVGNMWNEPIAAIWRNEPFDRMRRLMLSSKWKSLPMCKDCTDRKYRSWEYNVWSAMEEAREKRNE